MTLRTRHELVCDWCDKRLLLPLKNRGNGQLPGTWRVVVWDVYGNHCHYCGADCEKHGRHDIENHGG